MSCYRCKESTGTNKTFDARIKKKPEKRKNRKTERRKIGKSENSAAGPGKKKHTQFATGNFSFYATEVSHRDVLIKCLFA